MKQNDRVVQYSPEYSLCSGCKSCEILCSVFHEGVAGPTRTGIKLGIGPLKTMMHTIYVCQQCEDHPCYEVCPKKDVAMCIDENGIVYVNKDECIGCGKCVKNCKEQPSRIQLARRKDDPKKKYAVKCDMCRDIEGGPVCVRNCPVAALGLASQSNENLSAPLAKGGENA